MSFLELRLAEPIVRAVTAEGYTTPTPIQAQAIPEVLAGHDVLGCAQTGTGKTCAFALPILHRLAGFTDQDSAPSRSKPVRGRAPRALILCPTRELASQILESFIAYGRNLPLRHDAVFGGVSQRKQVQALQTGIDVLIATPGRLLDLINQRLLDLSKIEVLVLDEADRMLDMGFINDIRKVISLIPAKRQTLLFSATVSTEIRRLSESILKSPVYVQTARESTTAQAITQRIYMVQREQKTQLLEHMLAQGEVGRTLVFTKTKHGADKLVKNLHRSGINAEAIHSNKSQNARTRALNGFRTGQVTVLVATDIASRGIDVDDITHVVNFDMPIDPETYVHRIGRTARAGASGVAISFCDRDEVRLMRAIEKRTRMQIEVITKLPEMAAQTTVSAMHERPVQQHQPRQQSFGGGHPQPRRDGPRDERPRRGPARARSGKPAAQSGGRPSGRPGGRSGGRPGGESGGRSNKATRR